MRACWIGLWLLVPSAVGAAEPDVDYLRDVKPILEIRWPRG